ncbi:hypothetical protein DW088_14565 [Butyricicoccus sp. AM05-1]|nr:hypothetical protein DW088_14565 [Butyricicoccus sp. AM05-1]
MIEEIPVGCGQPQIIKRTFTRHGSSAARISQTVIFSLRSSKSAFLAKIKTQVSRIRKNVCVNKKDKPRAVRRRLRRQIEQQINAVTLRRQFGSELTGTVVTAVCNIKYADKLFIKGAAVTQERRETVAQMISSESVERFLDSTTLDFSRIKNPASYLQTALFAFLEKQCSTDSSPADEAPDKPLADWELEWFERVKAKRHSQETE